MTAIDPKSIINNDAWGTNPDPSYDIPTDFLKDVLPVKKKIDYVFNEKEILEELQKYIDGTYDEHYATGKVQTTQFFASKFNDTEAVGAFKFNVQKYTDRYGQKAGRNKKDLLKAAHYLVMLLYLHQEYEKKESTLTKLTSTLIPAGGSIAVQTTGYFKNNVG